MQQQSSRIIIIIISIFGIAIFSVLTVLFLMQDRSAISDPTTKPTKPAVIEVKDTQVGVGQKAEEMFTKFKSKEDFEAYLIAGEPLPDIRLTRTAEITSGYSASALAIIKFISRPSSELTTRIPRPPPPATAFSITGYFTSLPRILA